MKAPINGKVNNQMSIFILSLLGCSAIFSNLNSPLIFVVRAEDWSFARSLVFKSANSFHRVCFMIFHFSFFILHFFHFNHFKFLVQVSSMHIAQSFKA